MRAGVRQKFVGARGVALAGQEALDHPRRDALAAQEDRHFRREVLAEAVPIARKALDHVSAAVEAADVGVVVKGIRAQIFLGSKGPVIRGVLLDRRLDLLQEGPGVRADRLLWIREVESLDLGGIVRARCPQQVLVDSGVTHGGHIHAHLVILVLVRHDAQQVRAAGQHENARVDVLADRSHCPQRHGRR